MLGALKMKGVDELFTSFKTFGICLVPGEFEGNIRKRKW